MFVIAIGCWSFASAFRRSQISAIHAKTCTLALPIKVTLSKAPCCRSRRNMGSTALRFLSISRTGLVWTGKVRNAMGYDSASMVRSPGKAGHNDRFDGDTPPDRYTCAVRWMNQSRPKSCLLPENTGGFRFSGSSALGAWC